MSRVSLRQKRRRAALVEQLQLGMFPSGQGMSSGQGIFPSGSYRQTETTKETGDEFHQMREGSPFKVAAPFPHSQTEREAPTTRDEVVKRGDLLAAARATFQRKRLFSVDGHGRRSEIDTSWMGAAGYQKLLEAISKPIRIDDPHFILKEFPGEGSILREPVPLVREGCKLGDETKLPIPDWWQTPERGASREEIIALLKGNLQKAQDRQGGRSWRRAL